MAPSKKPGTSKQLPKHVTLALQGGGAHGAFAWGAVHQLLLDGRVFLDGITATGGGAIQAVVLAEGFRLNGIEGAIAHMERLWRSISLSASLMPLKPNPLVKFLGDVKVDFAPTTMAMDYMTRLFSPYQFNLFDLNPLRGIVSDLVDFDELRSGPPCPISINTTHAKTGMSRVFKEHELTLDVVMASSCLPYLFKTVMIDGEPYWDGAYSGNPALKHLLSETEKSDVLLVQTISGLTEDVPTSASDILDHATDISFNQALNADLELIAMHNNYNPNAMLTLHRIDSNEMLSSLGRASKLNVDWDFLAYLHDLGAQAMQDWLS